MSAPDNVAPTALVSPEIPRRTARQPSSALAWVMLVYIVVAVGRFENFFGFLTVFHLAKVVGAIGILIAIRQRDAPAQNKLTSFVPTRFMTILMGVVTFSILFSVSRSNTFGVIVATVPSVVIGTILILKAAKRWPDARVVMLGCVISSIVLAIMALQTSDYGRAGNISAYDTNDFAFVFVTLLPVVVAFAVTSRGFARLAYISISVLVILTILKTESRGGLLGLLTEIGVMIVLLPKNRDGKLDTRIRVRRILGRVLVVIAVGCILWSAIPQAARTRLATITSLGSDYNTDLTDPGRFTIWLDTLPLCLQRPWGWGANAFTTVDGQFAGGRYQAPHNFFLQALIELGFEGLILFATVLVSALILLGRASALTSHVHVDREEFERRTFSRAMVAGLLGTCVSGFFLSELYSQALWILVALACVVGGSLSAASAQPTPTPGDHQKALASWHDPRL